MTIFLKQSTCQTVSPSVFNTTGGGGAVGSTGVELYYNVGEPIVSTVTNGAQMITQGFLQPDIVGVLELSLTPLFQNESCLNKKDGFISLVLNTAPASAIQIRYEWQPIGVCPLQNCSSIDSLTPGTYSVNVKAYNALNVAIDSVMYAHTVLASTEPCQLNVFNGFTPNGDGINDSWVIENIENFPNNTVSIFNRWGSKIWSTSNYNNTDNKWDGKSNDGAEVISGTYFYVIEIDNGAKKGWVELSGK
ncbi:MAG: conserved repeat domain protein [Bacteroidota bacterium]|jgi:gliding motility-associated-like protein|nr:conserved repeat domain protein [Bacteroidota bacterium]